MFFKGSRYEDVPNATHTDSTGRQIPYKLLRIIPDTAAIQAHTVQPPDRLDLIAFRFYDDPQQFWRICDGNGALWPDDLLVVGERLVIPLVQR